MLQRTSKSIPRPDWTTGDRRSDAFVVGLLLATAILPAATFLVAGLGYPRTLQAYLDRGYREAGAVGVTYMFLRWLHQGWGAVGILVVTVAAVIRHRLRGMVLSLTASYQVVCGAALIVGLLAIHGRPIDMVRLSATAAWATVPALLLLHYGRRSRLQPMDALAMRAWAASVTRVLLFSAAVFAPLVRLQEFITWWPRLLSGAPSPMGGWFFELFAVLETSVPLLFLVSGLLLIRRQRIVRWALVVPLLADVLRCLIMAGDFTHLSQSLNQLQHLLPMFDPLPLMLVLAWYWWPVLTGRTSPRLDGDWPLCKTCGYNLTGNTSGVCPECGVAVAGAGL